MHVNDGGKVKTSLLTTVEKTAMVTQSCASFSIPDHPNLPTLYTKISGS